MTEENLNISETKSKSRRRELFIELGLIFALGFFVGIAVKNEAEKKITIGFDDYKMKMEPRDFSLNKMQDSFLNQQANEAN